ncbi:MAG: hypothetical protein ACJ8DI_05940 [Ktedonobacteraceae bacterium]
MAKQMIDAALRQQIAQWTRAALGQVVEDDGTMGKAAPIVEQTTCCITGGEPEVAGPGVMRYSRGRGAGRRLGTQVRKKEWSNAYPCGRGRAAPGVFAASRPAGRAPHR